MIIKKITDFFAEKPVLTAYLFGLYERGEGSKSNDVDLLVELDYSQPTSRRHHQPQGFQLLRVFFGREASDVKKVTHPDV